MNLPRNIICFQHCCPTSIFCNEVPKECPMCNEFLTSFLLQPFVVPYPLVNAKDHPCCIIVRPSIGSFLEDYNITDDLHTGVTNSDGHVIEYDQCGLVINNNIIWKNCAAIPLIPDSWKSSWDEKLAEMCDDDIWKPNNYDDTTFNCFNFVITFLKNLNYKNIQFMNKEDMCEVFILPKIQNIIKYATLCNFLKDKAFYIQE